MKNVEEAVALAEKASGIPYPPYFVEPVLTLVESRDNISGGYGVLYARTLPVEANGAVGIVVEISAPLVLYGTKLFLKTVAAHELLHYIELVRRFSRGEISSQLTASSVFEESAEDASRAMEPAKIYKEKKLLAQLKKRELQGFSDDALNEKIRIKWIEKGLPTVRLPVGRNQTSVSMQAVAHTHFEPRVLELVSRMQ